MRPHHFDRWDFKLFRNIVVKWWWYHNNELQLFVKRMRKEKWKLSVFQMFVKEIRVEKLRWRVCTFVTFANYGCDIFASLDLGSCYGQQCHLHLFCPHPHPDPHPKNLMKVVLIRTSHSAAHGAWSYPLQTHHMVSLSDHLRFYDRPQCWSIENPTRPCIMWLVSFWNLDKVITWVLQKCQKKTQKICFKPSWLNFKIGPFGPKNLGPFFSLFLTRKSLSEKKILDFFSIETCP